MDGYEYGYLLDDKEVMELLQSYRGLLPDNRRFEPNMDFWAILFDRNFCLCFSFAG